MLSEKRGLLITTHFWQLPRGNVAFCSNKMTPQLTDWMLNIDSYYECCQTQTAVLKIRTGRSSGIALANVRSGIKGLLDSLGMRFIDPHKMWNRSSTCDDGNSHGRMRLSLARCLSQKRSITRKSWPLKINFKGWEDHDKDKGRCKPTKGLF